MDNSSERAKLSRLAASLVRYGVGPIFAETIALGLLQQMRRWCWDNLVDLIGTAGQVDLICPSPLPPETLAKLMFRAGLLGATKEKFFLPSAYTDRPLAADKQWRRTEPDAFRRAKVRAKGKKEKEKVVISKEVPSLLLTFEEVVVVKEKPKKPRKMKEIADASSKPKPPPQPKPPADKGVPGYVEIVAHWFTEWGRTEGRGTVEYPFQSIDGKCVKDLIAHTTGAKHAKAVIDAYLACKDRFYAGHSLRKLIYDIPKFSAAAGGGGARAGEIAYSGGLEDIEVFIPDGGEDENGD